MPRTTVQQRPTTTEDDPAPATPAVEHRVITIVAAASLLVVSAPTWAEIAGRSPVPGTAFGAMFPVLLAVIAAALGARKVRTLARLDRLLIVAALGWVAVGLVPQLQRPRYTSDESILVFRGLQAVADGRNPYAGNWAAEIARAPTLLLDGTNPGRFGYPPLTPLLGGGLAHVVGVMRAPVVLATIALLTTAVLLYAMLPESRRGLVVPAVATISALPFFAAVGYPTATMVPLLVVACYRPGRLGADGRLGRVGATQAIALGLALAAQQIAWLVAPFLLVAVWRARRGELASRPALVVVLRVAGVALAAFAVVDLPFVIAGPGDWVRGVTDPLVQHGMFNGPGLPNLTLRVVGGGGDLRLWSLVAIVVFVTLLVLLALYPRTFGPGFVVLPFVALWVSLRAQTIYYLTALPLVIAAVGVLTASSDFAAARPIAGRLGPRLRALIPALGGVLAAGFVVAALVSPAPLTVRVQDVAFTPGAGLQRLTLRLHNRSDDDLTPHVTVDSGPRFTPFLRQVSGPRTVRPGETAVLVLEPNPARPVIKSVHEVFVVSDDPQTLSTTRLPRARRG